IEKTENEKLNTRALAPQAETKPNQPKINQPSAAKPLLKTEVGADRSASTLFQIESSKQEICLSETVSFSVKSKANHQFEWDFGDGKKSFSSNPSHKYLKDGIYKVSLTIADKKGNLIANL